MRPSRVLVLSAITPLLAACGTPQERAFYQDDPVAAMAAEYGTSCDKLGYGKGSKQWRSCIIQSSTHDDLARYAQYHDRYMQWYWLRP